MPPKNNAWYGEFPTGYHNFTITYVPNKDKLVITSDKVKNPGILELLTAISIHHTALPRWLLDILVNRAYDMCTADNNRNTHDLAHLVYTAWSDPKVDPALYDALMADERASRGIIFSHMLGSIYKPVHGSIEKDLEEMIAQFPLREHERCAYDRLQDTFKENEKRVKRRASAKKAAETRKRRKKAGATA